MIPQDAFLGLVKVTYKLGHEEEQDYNIPINLFYASGQLLDPEERIAAGVVVIVRLMCVFTDGVEVMGIPGERMFTPDAFIRAMLTEAQRARTLFPKSDFLATAMAEEVGEVVKACMDYMHKKAVTRDDIEVECIQAAAMVWRLLTEGDPTIGIEPVVEESV